MRTNNGPVCGIVAAATKQWLGIPYAAAPVGDLRWRSPQPSKNWLKPYPAVVSGSACPQENLGNSSAPSSNEDCLYLNVAAPSKPGSASLPVLVHIHGGGFIVGAASIYDGSYLAAKGNAIVVGMNYRLGVFGFLAHRALGVHSGDYALQDQQAALRWVKRNIAAFGGDPHNVTIFGESAGASSVCDQIASPTAAGLYEKAISESGEYNSLLGYPTLLERRDCKAILPTVAQAESIGERFSATVGCAALRDVAKCLRSVPTLTLLSLTGSGAPIGPISPTINGTTLTKSPRQAFASGDINRVPIVIGMNRDENLIGSATTPSEYGALVRAQFGSVAPQVLELYPFARFASPFVASRTIVADSATVCQALVTAQRFQVSKFGRKALHPMRRRANHIVSGRVRNACPPEAVDHETSGTPSTSISFDRENNGKCIRRIIQRPCYSGILKPILLRNPESARRASGIRRQEYNEFRPHVTLGKVTPAAYVRPAIER